MACVRAYVDAFGRAATTLKAADGRVRAAISACPCAGGVVLVICRLVFDLFQVCANLPTAISRLSTDTSASVVMRIVRVIA